MHNKISGAPLSVAKYARIRFRDYKFLDKKENGKTLFCRGFLKSITAKENNEI